MEVKRDCPPAKESVGLKNGWNCVMTLKTTNHSALYSRRAGVDFCQACYTAVAPKASDVTVQGDNAAQ